MAAALIQINPPPPPFQWTLIGAVTNRVFAATGFTATANPCRTKWNALKRGYENLKRIIEDNDDDIPITSPNSFDRACFGEMNDEFWLQTGSYLSSLFNCFYKQFINIVY
jgi:hypothetical protein